MTNLITQIRDRVRDLPQTVGTRLPRPLVKAKSRSTGRPWLRFLLLAPTIWALLYYGIFASDRYVSESQFIVRSSTRATATSGLSNLLRLIGISSSQDDTFAVHDFMTSRDAVTQLNQRINMAEIYGVSGADLISRWPNLLYGESADEFHRYLKNRIQVSFNPNTGISTISVQAFRPADAQKISSLLLDMSEHMVNRINTRIRDDSVRFSQEEVRQGEERLRQAQRAITEFRHREISLDPNRSSTIVMEVIARLSDEQSRLRAQIAETSASSPNSPQMTLLERRSEALRQQISAERARVTSGSDGLAEKIAAFEELQLDREFATRSLSSALVSLETAKAEARRQQLYLERVAGPNLADKALLPQRIIEIISIFSINMFVLLIGWLVLTGITEHAPKIEPDKE